MEKNENFKSFEYQAIKQIDEIKYIPNGDLKKKYRIANCLIYVLKNFDKIEPIIKQYWIDQETKKLKEDKER